MALISRIFESKFLIKYLLIRNFSIFFEKRMETLFDAKYLKNYPR